MAAVTILLLSAFIGGTYGLSRGLALILRRLSLSSPSRKRLTLCCRTVLRVLAVLGPILIAVTHSLGASLIGAAPSGRSYEVAAVATTGALVGTVITGSIGAINRGLEPAVAACTEYRHSIDERRRRWEAIAFTALVVGTASIGATTASDLTTVSTIWTVPVAIVLFVGYAYVRLSRTVPGTVSRDPTADEYERIERCYTEFDRAPGRIVVFDDAIRRVSVAVGGTGSSRWTWIHESVLGDADDDTLSIALAQAEAKNSAHFWPAVLTYVAVLFGLTAIALTYVTIPFDVSVASPSSILAAFTVCGLVLVSVALLARWATYRADDAVVSRFGVDRVTRAYDQIDTLAFLGGTRPSLGPLEPEPDAARRLHRLRDRYPGGDAPNQGQSDGGPTAPGDRIHGDGSVNTVWLPVVLVCTLAWAIVAVEFVTEQAYVPETALGVLFIGAWLGLPIGIYFDARRIRSRRQWPPYPKTVTLLSLVWFVNIAVACWYLWTRGQVVAGATDGHPPTADRTPDAHEPNASDADESPTDR